MPSHAELVGGSRQYDRESTNWTDSTLPSSDSFGLDSPEALLSSLGRSMDSLPPEMSYSLKQGIMSTELLQRWLHWEQRYLLRQLLRFPGMRERVLGDAAFLMKLGCPDNAFQVNQRGSQQYSIAQRWASIIINGILLFIVGFVSSIFGVGVINVLVAVRSFFDSHIEGIEMSQEVLGISMAHGIYMATSGNIRYQVLAGIVEERGVNRMFAHNVRLLRVISSLIRTINTYYGSEHWIVFIRYFGLQDA
ncbi:hypothetical protein WJX77_002398 [Trebouxia sp. C0004]